MNTKLQEQVDTLVLKADNNRRFRLLIDRSGLTQVEVMARFNKDMVRPVSLSAIKSWLSSPDSVRFRPMGSSLLAHAEKVLAKGAEQKSKPSSGAAAYKSHA